MENLEYFFSEINRIMASHYTPTIDDVIHCHRTTHRLHSVHIEMAGMNIECIEIPSNLQRNGRLKRGYMLESAKMVSV